MGDIKTYSEMNEKICGILRMMKEPSVLYAAKLIEQLQQRIKELEAEKTVIKCENCGGASRLAELHAEERTNHLYTQQERDKLKLECENYNQLHMSFMESDQENKRLKGFIDAQDELLVCYRIGRKPPGKLLDKLKELVDREV